MKFTCFETERLRICPMHTDDAEFLYKLMNTVGWLRHIGDRKVYSVKAARQYIREKMYPQLEKLGFSNNTLFLKSNNTPIGVCGIYFREKENRYDLGYALLPQFEKKGFAIEAASAVIQKGIKDYKMEKLSAITTKDNDPSQKLLIKSGFHFTGLITPEGENHELMLFEWELNKVNGMLA